MKAIGHRSTLTGISLTALCVSAGCGLAPEESEGTGSTTLSVDPYEECAAVLEGDLFNKSNGTSTAAAQARSIIWRTFLSLSENQAYDRYSSSYDEESRTGGGGGFTIFGVFSVNGSGGVERKLSREEFGEIYRYMKNLNASSNSYDLSDSSSFTSAYASYIRDANTIEAWRQCVTARPQPGLYAYGSRDDMGNVYVQVVWSPGEFAGVTPGIDVEFVPQEGFKVSPPRGWVAVGSGKSFAVEVWGLDRAFEIHVNGVYRKEGTDAELGSFNHVAKIPPAELPPIDVPDECERQRLLAFIAKAVSRVRLESLRSLGEVPIYREDGNPSSGIVAYTRCTG